MLELVSLSHQLIRRGKEPLAVLDAVSFRLPGGHLMGLVGATGSGKSVLLRTMAGTVRVQAGAVLWNGRDVTQNLWRPNEVALVTCDDASLQPLMSVKEHVVCAIMLQVGGISKRDAVIKADRLVLFCGLDTVTGVRVRDLTAVQRRRLLLALALAGDPLLVLCDDFMAGVDPRSQRELGALLQLVARENPNRVVINATQTLAELSAYDTVLVLHEGRGCFHGPGRAITHYFSIPHTEDLYHRLAKRPSQRWQDSWNRHRDSYYGAFKLMSGMGASEAELAAASDEDEDSRSEPGRLRLGRGPEPEDEEASKASTIPPPVERAGLGTQLAVLMRRRWTLFRRNKSEWWSHALLLIGLPLVGLILSWGFRGSLKLLHNPDWKPSATEAPALAGFAIGLTLLQVLMVMGAGVLNASREIADERSIWHREHFSGLRSWSFVLSKVLHVGTIALLQAFAIGLVFDLFTTGFPGNGALRVGLLALTGLAFNFLCLGISAWSRTSDKATSRAWCLAFLQAPLSGAILALPAPLGSVLQPLTTAFYGWSGSIETLKGSVLFEPITAFNGTWFATPVVAVILLLIHAGVGLSFVISGLRRR